MVNPFRTAPLAQCARWSDGVSFGIAWLALTGALDAACGGAPCEGVERVLTGSHELSGSEVDKLRCVKIATGDLRISGVDSLASLEALAEVRGDLTIVSSPELTSLQGLERLTRVGGTLHLAGNAKLTSLQGLESLEEVGVWLSIRGLPALEDLTGLERLRRVGGDVQVEGNAALRSVAALGRAGGARVSIDGDLRIGDNAVLESIDFGEPALGSPLVNGAISIVSNPSLREIVNPGEPARADGVCPAIADVWIDGNHALESVTLQFSVPRRACVSITDNQGLQRISGFLGPLVQKLRLWKLPALELLELEGTLTFDALAIGETGLAALDGLNASVRCSLDISRNPALVNLGRLESGPGEVASSLVVDNNPVLSQCIVAAMIDALPAQASIACLDPELSVARLERLVESRGNDTSVVCQDDGGE